MTLKDLREALKDIEDMDGNLEILVEICGESDTDDEWHYFRNLSLANISYEKFLLTSGERLVMSLEH